MNKPKGINVETIDKRSSVWRQTGFYYSRSPGNATQRDDVSYHPEKYENLKSALSFAHVNETLNYVYNVPCINCSLI